MHRGEIVARALELAQSGLNNSEISRLTGVARPTIRDWVRGALPHSYQGVAHNRICTRCGDKKHRFERLGGRYVYLLGLYLGDGSIATHPRGVYRLRITLDRRYPQIVGECEAAMCSVLPRSRPGRQLRTCNCYEVHSYSKQWPCLFPQHGPGKKHERPVYLADWQRQLAERWPEQLLKGLIQSDGCRVMNTGRNGWRHPRYAFANRSTDITSIFCSACDCLGLQWTDSFPKDESAAISIYVSRKADVAKLDEFVGTKR